MSVFHHQPILLTEVVAALQPKPGGRYVDGTLGGSGHAAAVLRASSPTGRLFACDRDGEAVAVARERLCEFGDRVEIRQGNYSELGGWIEAGSCDGVLLDLGVSSYQLDTAARGFSFLQDGPLDMRMNPKQGESAADLVARLSEFDLAKLFWELGDESQSRRLARAIVQDRVATPYRTTRQLAELAERVCPRGGRKTHPATRIFQALRMAVNDEMGHLLGGLTTCWDLLRPGGRFVVITFHSLEARAVKQFGQLLSRGYDVQGDVDIPELRQPKPVELRLVTRKPVEPGPEEVAANPRARSAQMRVMEKVSHGEKP